MHIVGTAGHVDHGKSALVAALTGVNPDRLKEEFAREMTIDLGFASMTLPDGEQIGIIDVPGHLHFIGNMLSGIGGIDAVLLVIAADEGVSAQTREHLAILDLLAIERGLIVLTKTDLVEPDWLELVSLEAQEVVRGTTLENAPAIAVSSKTGDGLAELTSQLSRVLKDAPTRIDLGRPRLPIDRVFSLTGFGTVVTGTLIDGSLNIGDEVIIQPGGLTARIRGLQNHKHKLQRVNPGYRTAVNLSGIDKGQINRGNVLTLPDTYNKTALLDVSFRLLPTASLELTHNLQASLFLGAAEIPAQVRLLGTDRLEPGETAFLQLKLAHPTIASRGDHFILRLPSPSETLGGGIVLDAHPTKTYRRFDPSLPDRMQQLLSGKEADLILEALTTLGVSNPDRLSKKTNLSPAHLDKLLADLLDDHLIIELTAHSDHKHELFITADQWHQNASLLTNSLKSFHTQYPLKKGTTREQLRAVSKLNPTLFDLILDKMRRDGQLRLEGVTISLADHQVILTPDQLSLAAALLDRFKAQPFTPPDRNEALSVIPEELLEGLVGCGKLVAVSDQIFFAPEAIVQMTDWVKSHIETFGSLSLAQFRDHFNTSRKYAAAFLEYLDSAGITLRKNDIRLLKQVK